MHDYVTLVNGAVICQGGREMINRIPATIVTYLTRVSLFQMKINIEWIDRAAF